MAKKSHIILTLKEKQWIAAFLIENEKHGVLPDSLTNVAAKYSREFDKTVGKDASSLINKRKAEFAKGNAG